MTTAVCFSCGELKFGAFNPCGKCGVWPASEDDFVMSLAMTDHYLDEPTLRKIGADIAAGKPVHLDEESRQNLLKSLRSLPAGVRQLAGAIGLPQHQEPASPWWKFWN